MYINGESVNNQQFKTLDYRYLTEQTAEKCFSDLFENHAGEITYHDFMYWLTEKKIFSAHKENILDHHKPPLKAMLLIKKSNKMKKDIKTFLKSKTLMNKIEKFKDETHLDKIHVFDAINAY